MSQLIGSWTALAWTALHAALVFLLVVTGLRLSQRRMLAELNAFDLAATVAPGAVFRRRATSRPLRSSQAQAPRSTLPVLRRCGLPAMHCAPRPPFTLTFVEKQLYEIGPPHHFIKGNPSWP